MLGGCGERFVKDGRKKRTEDQGQQLSINKSINFSAEELISIVVP